MEERVLPVHMLTGSKRSLEITGRLIEEMKKNRLDPQEMFGVIDAVISVIAYISETDYDKVLEHIAARVSALKLISKDSPAAAKIQEEIREAVANRNKNLGGVDDGIDAVLIKFKDRADPNGNLN